MSDFDREEELDAVLLALAILRSENDRLREALEVYADLEYWGAVQGDDQEYLFRESIGQKTYIQGKRARAALEGKE